MYKKIESAAYKKEKSMLHFLCQQGKANKSASRLSDLDILWIYQEMILRLTGQNDENIVFF